MTKQLSNFSDIATEMTNVPAADELSPILKISPEEGLALLIKGMVETGSAKGVPIYADLRDSNDDQLPTDTSIALQYKQKGSDDRQTVSHVQDHIRSYNTLDVDAQQNEENIDAVKHVLKGTEEALDEGVMPKIGVRHIDNFYISINSSTKIDWANSRIYVDRNAVSEFST